MRPPVPLLAFAEPPDGPAPLHDQFALPGADGRRAIDLLRGVKAAGVATMANLFRQAVTRLAVSPTPLAATTLLDDGQLRALQDSLAAATAAGDLLGRARVRGLADKAGVEAFAEGGAFDAFADPVPMLLPRAAIDYFRRLVPALGVDPQQFGPLLDRHAFTLAHAADQVVLGKVKDALSQLLQGERPGGDLAGLDNLRGGEAVGQLLAAAGVSPENPQYAEMVYRTNLMDAYHQGGDAELATPDMQAAFPAWQYLGIDDGREGADHRPKFDRYYPAAATFAEVRGDRPFNCRCSKAPVTAGRWAKLQIQGATLETSW